MTRALSIPPDAAARMMMLVSHDKKSQQSRPASARSPSREATDPALHDIVDGSDSLGAVAEVHVTET